MNRDKKLLMAFINFFVKGSSVSLYNSIDTFLASPDYKEFEVREEEIMQAAKEIYGEDVGLSRGKIIAFINGANFIQQHGTK